MTALDDAIAKADEVLALERESRHSETILQHHDVAVRRDRLAAAMPDLARALKAVDWAISDSGVLDGAVAYLLREAINRKLGGAK